MGDMKFRMLLQKLFLVMVSTMLCPKIVYCVHINLGDGSTMAAARVNIICKNFVCFRNRGWGPGKGEEQRRFAMSLWPNEKLLDSALKAVFFLKTTIVWGFDLSRVSSWGFVYNKYYDGGGKEHSKWYYRRLISKFMTPWKNNVLLLGSKAHK
jgi:hypothetical protein